MLIKKLNEQDIINIAIKALNESKTSYDVNSLDVIYDKRLGFKNGKKPGWSVSARLNVPDSFEPNMIFVSISEDAEEIYIPEVL